MSDLEMDASECTDGDDAPIDCPVYLDAVWDRGIDEPAIEVFVPDRVDPEDLCTLVLFKID